MSRNQDSYVKFFRRVIGHPVVWEYPYSRFQAWSEMIMQANYSDDGCLKRGQLIVGRRYLSQRWGWSESKVLRFLKCLELEEMISIQVLSDTTKKLKTNLKSGFFDTTIRTNKITRLSLITITNYSTYQETRGYQKHETIQAPDTTNDTTNDTTSDTIKKEEEKKRKKRVRTDRRQASHDPEFLRQELSSVIIPEFEKEFQGENLNVKSCYGDFESYVLSGSAKDPRPNPSGWVDFPKAFRNSCKGAIEKGLHRLNRNSQPVDNSERPRPKTAQELVKDETANQEKEATVRANTLAAIERLPPPDRADLERRALAFAEKSAKRIRRKVTQDLIDAAKIELYQQAKNGGSRQIDFERLSGP